MSNPASLSLREYFHAPAIAAGFAAVLIGYSGSAVIVFQAAKAAGADSLQISSWMMVLGIGLGLTSIGLSWRYKMPIITAWSTPGAALLATSLGDIGMAEAIGAFLFSGALITLCGVSGWFERIIDRIPLPLAAAMLAGILFQFGVDAFTSMESQLRAGAGHVRRLPAGAQTVAALHHSGCAGCRPGVMPVSRFARFLRSFRWRSMRLNWWFRNFRLRQ